MPTPNISPNKFYAQSWFYWLIFIIIAAGLGWFFYNQYYLEPVDWTDGANKSAIQVIENNDGTKTVRNVEGGYEVSIPQDWQVVSFDDETLAVSEPDIDQVQMFSGVSIQIKSTDISDIVEFFQNKINLLDDEGIEITRRPDFIINGVNVQLIVVDYSQSYWPSSGEITYFYHFIKNNKFLNVSYSSINRERIIQDQDIVLKVIEDILS